MDVSIIIVNWNSVAYLEQCLASIYREIHDLQYEVVVVDNASFDGCDVMINSKYPEVIFVQSDTNLGFARANNLGYQHASGKALLFLNPDTEIIGSAVSRLYTALNSTKDCGAVGCRLLDADLTLQLNSVLSYPTLLNQFLDCEFLKKRTFPGVGLWKIEPMDADSDLPMEVEAVSGACIMVKQELFNKIKQFSTDYFMYSEDVDLCRKINMSGYKVRHLPTVSVIHFGGGSSRKRSNNFFGAILLKESKRRYFEKFHGKLKAGIYSLTIMMVSLLRILLIVMFLPFARLFEAWDKATYALLKWYKIFKWSIGLEKWAGKLAVTDAPLALHEPNGNRICQPGK